mmetsp:Transcript_96173/g.206355  ORF Transcript_96173/g.206355 Transcript_96173/m.206355 type:complete len:289 (+) Transcript_96173:772-1638(+)
MAASSSFLIPTMPLTSSSRRATALSFSRNSAMVASTSGNGLKSILVNFSSLRYFSFFCLRTTSYSSSVAFAFVAFAFVAFSAVELSSAVAFSSALSSSVAFSSPSLSSVSEAAGSSFAAPSEALAATLVTFLLFFTVAFTQMRASTVMVGALTSMMPLISRGTVAEIFGDPVILYSFQSPSNASETPVTAYSAWSKPSSKTRMAKFSSDWKASFFLPPKAVPLLYNVVMFLSHSPFEPTTCTEYSWFVMSVKKIFLTRKDLLELAATRAAPRAAASSPLRCCPNGNFS